MNNEKYLIVFTKMESIAILILLCHYIHTGLLYIYNNKKMCFLCVIIYYHSYYWIATAIYENF